MEAQGSESSEFWKALGETPTAFVGVSFHQEYTNSRVYQLHVWWYCLYKIVNLHCKCRKDQQIVCSEALKIDAHNHTLFTLSAYQLKYSHNIIFLFYTGVCSRWLWAGGTPHVQSGARNGLPGAPPRYIMFVWWNYSVDKDFINVFLLAISAP